MRRLNQEVTKERSGPAVHRTIAWVTAVREFSPGALLLELSFEDSPGEEGAPIRSAEAVAYPALVGQPAPGDRVLLNTTAVDLRLGTGGRHFVIALLNRLDETPGPDRGHIIKLRYTPHQCRVFAAEEEGSPFAGALNDWDDLQGVPVIACELHSQIAGAAAGFLAERPGARVVYVMTDGACLPAAFSTLLPRLKHAGLLYGVITSGQAFGGDVEAINLYSALLVARHGLGAEMVIAGQGPGNAGTGSRFGFSGLSQGEIANAAASLGGRPIVCLRASAADARERHQTPSHHTLTVLDRVARCRCITAIARDAPGARRTAIFDALRSLGLPERHDVQTNHRGRPGVDLLRQRAIQVESMGRSLNEDLEFFLHASAAGAAAASVLDLSVRANEAPGIMAAESLAQSQGEMGEPETSEE